MPDMLGYWDRRADDPDYVGDDALGNPIFNKSKKGIVKKKLRKNRYIAIYEYKSSNFVGAFDRYDSSSSEEIKTEVRYIDAPNIKEAIKIAEKDWLITRRQGKLSGLAKLVSGLVGKMSKTSD